MRLADFIEANTELILTEWVTFASTSGPAGETMDLAGLRDHALQMLTIIVKDLRTPQTKTEQSEKSKGTADSTPATADTPAEVHGAGRAASGFTLGEMVSEYRALRASVIRLWTKQCGTLKGEDLEDLMRFNEAIDQSTAESITRFTGELHESRDRFLAILGHDLQTPLGAVIMSSQFMLDTGELREPHVELTSRILRSGRRMSRMVGDLLDFTRSRLGPGIPIVRREMDLGKVVDQAVEETSAAEPHSVIQSTATGDLRGEWDSSRISQALTNLLSNAVQHGTPKAPIRVTTRGDEQAVEIQVHNSGPAIAAADLPELFSAMKTRASGRTSDSKHMGLGLYIAERIVSAHGGTLEVASSAETGTTFTMRLPRVAPAPSAVA